MEIKREIPTIAEKNRIIGNIITAMDTRDGFLINGHESPDEDCIASMVAMGLLLNKLIKTVYLFICGEIQENFSYLLRICDYNSIEIISDCSHIPEGVSTIIYVDTPKPDMLMGKDLIRGYAKKEDLLEIELDHHLEADGSYSGQKGYRLVTDASSTCEIIGILAFKMRNRKDLMEKYQIKNIFSRNFVISVLTGIIGDSKMGKYLKTSKEKWFYRLFSEMFDQMLSHKTYRESSNFSNMEEVFEELQKLSQDEEGCYTYMMERKSATGNIHHCILDKDQSKHIFQLYDGETVVNVARVIADKLAEAGGYVSLVGYFDDPKITNFIQFRMRRSEAYKSLDLREVINKFHITNGGGHPGAVGFRVLREDVEDLDTFASWIIDGTNKMIAES